MTLFILLQRVRLKRLRPFLTSNLSPITKALCIQLMHNAFVIGNTTLLNH